MGTESEDGFVFGKVRGRDVARLVVAFVAVLVHADKLTGKRGLRAIEGKIFLDYRSYAARLDGGVCGGGGYTICDVGCAL